MPNDNEKYLKEFIDFTNGRFDATTFNDAICLTDNESVRLTVELNNAIMNKQQLCYMEFQNEIAEYINIPTTAENFTFGLFLKAPSPAPTADPYNVVLLANKKDTFKLLLEILNQHHFKSYHYDLYQNSPKMHRAKELGFNVRACTFDGETTMEKISFNSFSEHLFVTDSILKTLPIDNENEISD